MSVTVVIPGSGPTYASLSISFTGCILLPIFSFTPVYFLWEISFTASTSSWRTSSSLPWSQSCFLNSRPMSSHPTELHMLWMLEVVFYLRTADLSLFLYYFSWSMIWPSTQLPIPGSSKSTSFLTTYTSWSPEFGYSTTQVCLRFLPAHHPWSRLS